MFTSPAVATLGPRSKLRIEALEVPAYRYLLAANLAWNVGRWMEQIAVGWLAYELTRSPFLVAMIGFYRMIPILFLGTLGGVIGDRFDRRRLIFGLQLTNVACMSAVAALSAAGRLTYDYLAVAEIVMGASMAFDWPSRGALTIDLVGRKLVASATALDASGQNLSRTIGPLVSGAIIAALSPAPAFLFLAVAYFASALIILRVPGRHSPGVSVKSPGVFRSLAAGFGYVLRDQVVVGVLVITVAMNLFFFPYQQMLPVVADQVFRAGSLGLGFLSAADGFGSLVGTLLIATVGGGRRSGLIFWCGSIVGCVCLIAFALSRSFVLALALLAVGGLGRAGFAALQSALILGRASDEMRGRSLGVLSLAISTGPFGALEVGAVAQAVSASAALVVNATLCAVLVAIVAARTPKLRQV